MTLHHKNLPVYSFKDQSEFYDFMSRRHDSLPAFWLRYYKKHTGKPSIAHSDAVDVALCWGWIDGLLNKYDDESYVVRYTPRRPKSIWSQINVAKVSKLIADGRMQPSGLTHVEAAKADGRWAAAYAPASSMEFPEEFYVLLNRSPKAKKHFAALKKSEKYSYYFKISQCRDNAKRSKVIEEIVARLAV